MPSIALAEEVKPADPKPEVARRDPRRVPVRVVKMLPETRQVLLLDRNRGTHVVAEAGQELEGGYIVDAIEDDEVTLIAPTGAEIILAAPETRWRRRTAEQVPSGEPLPQDPYIDAPAPGRTTMGPSSTLVPSPVTDGELQPGDGGVRVASASGAASTATASVDIGGSATELAPDPYVDPSPSPAPGRSGPAPGAAATPAMTPSTPAASPTSPATSPAESPAPAPALALPPARAASEGAASDELGGALAAAATGSSPSAPSIAAAAASKPATLGSFLVTRQDVDAALADFGATAVTFHASFVPDGLRIESIAPGTILGKLGLRAGDVILSVDNQPLRSFDDAAVLYARAGTARAATLRVLRGGAPTTLRVTIQ